MLRVFSVRLGCAWVCLVALLRQGLGVLWSVWLALLRRPELMATLRKGIAALAGVGAVAAVGQHLASAPSRVHPLLQAYHAGGRTAATGSRAASSLPGKALPVFETNW